MVASRTQTGRTSGGASAAVGERLQALVDRVISKRRIAHAVVGLEQRDGARWIVAAGDARPGEPMCPATPFFIASVTKRFIATLVLQAYERGELALDDPIIAHLPAELTNELHVHKGVDHTAAITVHHLLTHTSGLPDYFDKPKAGPSLYQQLVRGEDRSWSLADVARMVREDHRPHFPPQDLSAPRQRARYSDTGFQLLIAILEAATGRTFAELLHGRCADSDPSRRHLATIMAEADRLSELTGDLLRFSRDSPPPAHVEARPAELIRQTVAPLRPLLERAHVEVHLDLDERTTAIVDAPGLRCWGEASLGQLGFRSLRIGLSTSHRDEKAKNRH